MSLDKIKKIFHFTSPSKPKITESHALPSDPSPPHELQDENEAPLTSHSPQEVTEIEERPFSSSPPSSPSPSSSSSLPIELNMFQKIQIGKRFHLNIEEISTLTTASLRADLISLEVSSSFDTSDSSDSFDPLPSPSLPFLP